MPAASKPGSRRIGGRVALAVAAAVLMASCDASVDRSVPSTPAGSTAPTTPTSLTIAPVTPDGFSTGPGVSDDEITLGLLVDPQRDRGFTAGVQLWQQAVNTSGGLCGRTVRLVTNGANGVPADPVEAYDVIGRTSLGLLVLPAADEVAALTARISSDQLPTLTPAGTSTQLGPTRPIVIAATEDILAINALGYLDQAGRLADGATVGVLSDGSANALNGLQGARWWAAEQGITLDVRDAPDPPTSSGSASTDSSDPGTEPTVDAGTTAVTGDAGATDPELADWGDAQVVLALTDPVTTARLVAQTPAEVTVLTTIDGYDPATWDDAALAGAAAGRVLISAATPAVGSDYPAALLVAARYAATGQNDPGPRLLDGYGSGVNWARLLTESCDNRALTRQAVQRAAATVGAASVDSLFGPTDPAGPAVSGLPATRVSAMSVADPEQASGLRPLTWPQAAPGIGDYVP